MRATLWHGYYAADCGAGFAIGELMEGAAVAARAVARSEQDVERPPLAL